MIDCRRQHNGRSHRRGKIEQGTQRLAVPPQRPEGQQQQLRYCQQRVPPERRLQPAPGQGKAQGKTLCLADHGANMAEK